MTSDSATVRPRWLMPASMTSAPARMSSITEARCDAVRTGSAGGAGPEPENQAASLRSAWGTRAKADAVPMPSASLDTASFTSRGVIWFIMAQCVGPPMGTGSRPRVRSS